MSVFSFVFISEGQRLWILNALLLSSSYCSLPLLCSVTTSFKLSVISQQCLLDLPCLLMPFNLPSEICVLIYWALIMWPKYWSFLLFTLVRNSVCSLCHSAPASSQKITLNFSINVVFCFSVIFAYVCYTRNVINVTSIGRQISELLVTCHSLLCVKLCLFVNGE